MTETAYRFLLMIFFGAMLMWGTNLQQSTDRYTTEKPRVMVMVDAYEYYNDTGKPGWTGVFRDKEFNTRIENSIEPRTYRDFVNTNSAPRDMVVTKSLKEVKAPGVPDAKIFWGVALLVLGIMGVLYNIIAVIFFRNPWRFS